MSEHAQMSLPLALHSTTTPRTHPASPVLGSDQTRLDPAGVFPEDLSELSLEEVQALDSRLRRQLDTEVLSPSGAHPWTLDHQQEVACELDARQ
ncbi:hypothetical protein [Kocuria arenosa]|uniref:hypothetical protein n=1 Tax=Kocuria arenosa TaxID=3071446 RepID=UPI0034D596D5